MRSLGLGYRGLKLLGVGLLLLQGGCSFLSERVTETPVVRIFLNPFCPTFRGALGEVAAVRFDHNAQERGVRVVWHPLLLAGNECDNRVALAIVCAASHDESAALIDAVAESPFSLATCTPAEVNALIDETSSHSAEIQSCISAEGEQLLTKSFAIADAASVSMIPMCLAPGEKTAAPTQSLVRLLSTLQRSQH